MTGDELDAVRAKLAARTEDCWARLDDAVSELYAVHAVEAEEISARVLGTIERERGRDPKADRASRRTPPPE